MTQSLESKKEMKRIEENAISIQVDFSYLLDRRLGFALQDIVGYKATPCEVHVEITPETARVDLFLPNSRGNSPNLKDATRIALNNLDAEWNTLGLWVIKDKYKAFEIYNAPLPELVMRVYEPRARLILAELELWDAIFDASRDMKTALPYDDCIQAWLQTQLESKRFDFSNIYSGLGYRARADNLSQQKAQITDLINPFDLDIFNCKHHYNMANAALSIVKSPGRQEQDAMREIRKNFRTRAWHPYLEAVKAYLRFLRKGVPLPNGSKIKPKTLYVKGDSLMLQDGKQARDVLSHFFPMPNKSSHKRGKYSRKA